jgi:hypothetical protein
MTNGEARIRHPFHGSHACPASRPHSVDVLRNQRLKPQLHSQDHRSCLHARSASSSQCLAGAIYLACAPTLPRRSARAQPATYTVSYGLCAYRVVQFHDIDKPGCHTGSGECLSGWTGFPAQHFSSSPASAGTFSGDLLSWPIPCSMPGNVGASDADSDLAVTLGLLESLMVGHSPGEITTCARTQSSPR